jgi:hypothetical protein
VKSTKVLAFLICAIVAVSGVGYYTLFSREPSQPLSYTTEQTLATSSSAVPATPTTNSWITGSATQPISYYLKLLEQNKTEPYVTLAKELRKLPDLSNATAVAKVVSLALNASNPEVKEAFELMIKGGTPDQSDFSYPVPEYNTELEVLYRLALQNEFKQDDTLAMSIAMAHGLWVTIGNEQVRNAVYKDTTELLRYFRDTNEIQKQQGYAQLEDYPLEAKLALAWTANSALRDGPHSIFLGPNSVNPYRNNRRMDLAGYQWNMLNVTTMRQMRRFMDEKGFVSFHAGKTVGNIERYLYFSNPRRAGVKGGMDSDHWYYVYEDLTPDRVTTITVDGQPVRNYVINNVDWLFSYLVQNGMGIGQCGDECALVDGFAKSCGIATLPAGRMVRLSETERTGHGYVVYYYPVTSTWSAYDKQLEMDIDWISRESVVYFVTIKPPVDQHEYLRDWMEDVFWCGKMTHLWWNTTLQEIQGTFVKGLPTVQMKQWLLYS